MLAPCGLAGGQITTHDLADAEVKQAMVRSAARVIIAADSSKFRQTALAVVGPVSDADLVITDAGAPPDAVAALRADGLEVRCV